MNFLFNQISQRQALNSMIVLLTVVLLFHVLVLWQVIPYTIVWAGRVSSVEEMRVMETVSIAINAFIMVVMILKANYIKSKIPAWALKMLIWIFALVFALNTIGNLFSKMALELYLFTALTFVSMLLCLRIVLEKKE